VPAWLARGGIGLRAARRRGVDPFQALEVQAALARLDREITELRSSQAFACAHHLRAAMAAYDDLLVEACRLAGVGPPRAARGSVWRVLVEAELHAAGWCW
jgi:hypothetical protein